MSIGGGQGGDQTAELWGLMGGEQHDSPTVHSAPPHRSFLLLRQSWETQSEEVRLLKGKIGHNAVTYWKQRTEIIIVIIIDLMSAHTTITGSSEQIPDAMKNAVAWIMKIITIS